MQTSKTDIAKKGEKIYYTIQPGLEKKYKPYYYVAIEVETGNYFVGRDQIESIHKAQRIYPNKQFFLAQIGSIAGSFI